MAIYSQNLSIKNGSYGAEVVRYNVAESWSTIVNGNGVDVSNPGYPNLYSGYLNFVDYDGSDYTINQRSSLLFDLRDLPTTTEYIISATLYVNINGVRNGYTLIPVAIDNPQYPPDVPYSYEKYQTAGATKFIDSWPYMATYNTGWKSGAFNSSGISYLNGKLNGYVAIGLVSEADFYNDDSYWGMGGAQYNYVRSSLSDTYLAVTYYKEEIKTVAVSLTPSMTYHESAQKKTIFLGTNQGTESLQISQTAIAYGSALPATYTRGQTFTATSDNLGKFRMRLYNNAGSSATTVFFALYATDVNGLPTGSALQEKYIWAATLGTAYAAYTPYVYFDYPLVKGRKYAILFRGSATGLYFNGVNSNPYAGGNYITYGSSWSNQTSTDTSFDIYGNDNIYNGVSLGAGSSVFYPREFGASIGTSSSFSYFALKSYGPYVSETTLSAGLSSFGFGKQPSVSLSMGAAVSFSIKKGLDAETTLKTLATELNIYDVTNPAGQTSSWVLGEITGVFYSPTQQFISGVEPSIITDISVKISRASVDPLTVTMSLYAADSQGKPTGGAIFTHIFPTDSTSTLYETYWLNHELESPLSTNGASYVIQLSATGKGSWHRHTPVYPTYWSWVYSSSGGWISGGQGVISCYMVVETVDVVNPGITKYVEPTSKDADFSLSGQRSLLRLLELSSGITVSPSENRTIFGDISTSLTLAARNANSYAGVFLDIAVTAEKAKKDVLKIIAIIAGGGETPLSFDASKVTSSIDTNILGGRTLLRGSNGILWSFLGKTDGDYKSIVCFRSTDDGVNWAETTAFAGDEFDDIKGYAACETGDGKVLLLLIHSDSSASTSYFVSVDYASGSWTPTNVVSGAGDGPLGITVDDSGNVYAAFEETGYGYIFFWKYTINSVWAQIDTITVDAHVSSSHHVIMDITPSGNVEIYYQTGSGDIMRHVYEPGVGFGLGELLFNNADNIGVTNVNAGTLTDVIIDNSGNSHFIIALGGTDFADHVIRTSGGSLTLNSAVAGKGTYPFLTRTSNGDIYSAGNWYNEPYIFKYSSGTWTQLSTSANAYDFPVHIFYQRDILMQSGVFISGAASGTAAYFYADGTVSGLGQSSVGPVTLGASITAQKSATEELSATSVLAAEFSYIKIKDLSVSFAVEASDEKAITADKNAELFIGTTNRLVGYTMGSGFSLSATESKTEGKLLHPSTPGLDQKQEVTHTFESTPYMSQSFTPTADKIERLSLYCADEGYTHANPIYWRIYASDAADRATGVVLAEKILTYADFTASASWVDWNNINLDVIPGQKYVIWFRRTAPTNRPLWSCSNSTDLYPGGKGSRSADGSNWSYLNNDGDFVFRIYGAGTAPVLTASTSFSANKILEASTTLIPQFGENPHYGAVANTTLIPSIQKTVFISQNASFTIDSANKIVGVVVDSEVAISAAETASVSKLFEQTGVTISVFADTLKRSYGDLATSISLTALSDIFVGRVHESNASLTISSSDNKATSGTSNASADLSAVKAKKDVGKTILLAGGGQGAGIDINTVFGSYSVSESFHDPNQQYTRQSGIAIDSSGSLHSVSVEYGQDEMWNPPKINYFSSSDNGATWSSATLIVQFSEMEQADTVGIAVGADDIVFIFYGRNSNLYYRKSSDSWASENQLFTGAGVYGAAIATDLNGDIHIASYNWGAGFLYAKYSGGSWSGVSSLPTSTPAGSFSLACDRVSGNPYFVYGISEGTILSYIYHNGSSWQAEQNIDSGPNYYSGPMRVFFDNDNKLRIINMYSPDTAYYCFASYVLDGTWTKEIVIAASYQTGWGQKPAVSVSKDGVIHAFYDVNNTEFSNSSSIYYIYNDGSWSTPVLMSDTESELFEGYGQPFILDTNNETYRPSTGYIAGYNYVYKTGDFDWASHQRFLNQQPGLPTTGGISMSITEQTEIRKDLSVALSTSALFDFNRPFTDRTLSVDLTLSGYATSNQAFNGPVNLGASIQKTVVKGANAVLMFISQTGQFISATAEASMSLSSSETSASRLFMNASIDMTNAPGIGPEAGTSYNNVGPIVNNNFYLSSRYWASQQFIATHEYVARVYIYLNNAQNQNWAFEVYNSNGSSIPTGAAISSITYDASSLVPVGQYAWASVALNPANVTIGQKYCLVVRGSSGIANAGKHSITDNNYPDGAFAYSSNYGSSFVLEAGGSKDIAMQIYGADSLPAADIMKYIKIFPEVSTDISADGLVGLSRSASMTMEADIEKHIEKTINLVPTPFPALPYAFAGGDLSVHIVFDGVWIPWTPFDPSGVQNAQTYIRLENSATPWRLRAKVNNIYYYSSPAYYPTANAVLTFSSLPAGNMEELYFMGGGYNGYEIFSATVAEQMVPIGVTLSASETESGSYNMSSTTDLSASATIVVAKTLSASIQISSSEENEPGQLLETSAQLLADNTIQVSKYQSASIGLSGDSGEMYLGVAEATMNMTAAMGDNVIGKVVNASVGLQAETTKKIDAAKDAEISFSSESGRMYIGVAEAEISLSSTENKDIEAIAETQISLSAEQYGNLSRELTASLTLGSSTEKLTSKVANVEITLSEYEIEGLVLNAILNLDSAFREDITTPVLWLRASMLVRRHYGSNSILSLLADEASAIAKAPLSAAMSVLFLSEAAFVKKTFNASIATSSFGQATVELLVEQTLNLTPDNIKRTSKYLSAVLFASVSAARKSVRKTKGATLYMTGFDAKYIEIEVPVTITLTPTRNKKVIVSPFGAELLLEADISKRFFASFATSVSLDAVAIRGWVFMAELFVEFKKLKKKRKKFNENGNHYGHDDDSCDDYLGESWGDRS